MGIPEGERGRGAGTTMTLCGMKCSMAVRAHGEVAGVGRGNKQQGWGVL